jgi:hypothetical protein
MGVIGNGIDWLLRVLVNVAAVDFLGGGRAQEILDRDEAC